MCARCAFWTIIWMSCYVYDVNELSASRDIVAACDGYKILIDPRLQDTASATPAVHLFSFE